MIYSKYGLISCPHPLAGLYALDILKKGGHAVDAAICANTLLSVLMPHQCGPGGDLWALIWDSSTHTVSGLQATSKIPINLKKEVLLNQGISKIPDAGVLTIGVPGCPDGWQQLNSRFGKLPWKDLLAAARVYAEFGYPVTSSISEQWKSLEDKLLQWDIPAKTFLHGDRAPNPGELFRNSALSKTLGILSDQGRGSFYRGTITEQMLQTTQSLNIPIIADDFNNYSPQWVEPVVFSCNGKTIYRLPLLGLVNPATDCSVKEMLPAYPRSLCSGVMIQVIDREKNAVSLFQSLYTPFGSGIIPGDLGFMMGSPLSNWDVEALGTDYIPVTSTPWLIVGDNRIEAIYSSISSAHQLETDACYLSQLLGIHESPSAVTPDDGSILRFIPPLDILSGEGLRPDHSIQGY